MNFLWRMDFCQKLWYDIQKFSLFEVIMDTILSDSTLQKTFSLFGLAIPVRWIAAAVLVLLGLAACGILRKTVCLRWRAMQSAAAAPAGRPCSPRLPSPAATSFCFLSGGARWNA